MHEHHLKGLKVKFSLLVASSTRTALNDDSGRAMKEIVERYNHEVVNYQVVPDSEASIQEAVMSFLKDSDCVVISGGTGITRNDVTVEAVRNISDFEISGFNIIFMIKSYQQVGTASMLSRASAFSVGRKPVFCLPGSPRAAVMGLEEIIIPEIDHVIHELGR